jgi:hypothetical protein
MSALLERKTVAVASLVELNEYFVQADARASMSVAGRYERRDGQLWCLGGLNWQLSDGPVTVSLATGEDDPLPDLPVVRAMGLHPSAVAR